MKAAAARAGSHRGILAGAPQLLSEALPELVGLIERTLMGRLVLRIVAKPVTAPAAKPTAAVQDAANPLAQEALEPTAPAAELGGRVDERHELVHVLPVAAMGSGAVEEPQSRVLDQVIERSRLLPPARPGHAPGVARRSRTL
jgi:hypothetical protein